jgi:hypothetical protein
MSAIANRAAGRAGLRKYNSISDKQRHHYAHNDLSLS